MAINSNGTGSPNAPSDGLNARPGEVILALPLKEGREVAQARVDLNADQYQDAIEAHKAGAIYIQVTSVLHAGRQPRRLDRVCEFTLLS